MISETEKILSGLNSNDWITDSLFRLTKNIPLSNSIKVGCAAPIMSDSIYNGAFMKKLN